MTKKLLICFLIALIQNVKAQDSNLQDSLIKTNLLHTNIQLALFKYPDLLINTTARPIINSFFELGYQNYFNEFDTTTNLLKISSINGESYKPFQHYDSTLESYVSDYSKMSALEFKVIGLYEIANLDSIGANYNYVLALKNETIGTIFFAGQTANIFTELEIIEGVNLKDISLLHLFFNKEITFKSNDLGGLEFIKKQINGYTNYYLSFNDGSYEFDKIPELHKQQTNFIGKGLLLYFTDGTTLKIEPIEYNNMNLYGLYAYRGTMELNTEQLEVLSTKMISHAQLLTEKVKSSNFVFYKIEISAEDARLFNFYVNMALNE